MSIDQISNVERQSSFRLRDWVGWHVGWATGWYNPFDRLQDLVTPVDLGRLVRIQGEFMQEQARLMGEQGKVIQGLGEKLSGVVAATQQKG